MAGSVSETRVPDHIAHRAPRLDHEGSASPVLSGRLVVLVWLISILLHTVILLVTLAIVFPFTPHEAPESPTVHVEIVGNPDATGVASPQAPNPSDTEWKEQSEPPRFTPERFERLAKATTPSKTDLPIIGIGTGGGDFSRYGLSVGAGSGPEFFGLGRSARGAKRIVYVVDRSGSMLDTFGHVRAELIRSISELRRSQKFHVIFFNAGRPLENPPKRLVSAIKAQKEQLFRFLDTVYPEGSTDPAPAMRRALATDPDLVYFLTDGEFDSSLVAKLDQWNKDRTVKIFTIAYFDQSGAALLEEIARRNGGKFRFVTENDLP